MSEPKAKTPAAERRYLGVDGEYHVPPCPHAKHHNLHLGGYVPGATEQDRKELADAIKQCEEAAQKRDNNG